MCVCDRKYPVWIHVLFLALTVLCQLRIVIPELQVQQTSAAPGTSAQDRSAGQVPLCSHKKALQNLTNYDTGSFHSPHYFYEYHVKPSVPVIFRNVGRDFPQLKDWNDDSYLSEKFGDDVVSVESTKKENRSSPVLKIRLKEFLWRYKSEELYMVHHVSDHMKEILPLVKPLQCGGFQKMLVDPVLWLSSGGTKSVLHRDEFNNLNCVLDGKKEFVFIDKNYKEAVEKNGFVDLGHYSLVDVDRVDLEMFPELVSVPCYKVTLDAGDCVFIPIRWYHQVRSFGSRNMAFNVWFAELLRFDIENCGNEQNLPEFDALSKYDFTGHLEQMRVDVLENFQGLDTISLDDCQQGWRKKLADTADIKKLFDLIDSNKDQRLSWTELYGFDVQDVVRKYPLLFVPEEQNWEKVDHKETITSDMFELPKEEL